MNQSKISTYWLMAGWLGVGLILYFSLTPSPPQFDIKNEDKFGHLAAYGLVTLCFAQSYTSLRQRILLALSMVALGIAMEYAQRATGYRNFDAIDMLANASGVAIGWAAAPYLPNFLAWTKKCFS